ncbi:hypothetical protein DFJ77DRAFT_506912 [Powellomyces hirtus]|nr:hypothetical protein DFJ77DRAFT_506912 [Powellomyces hirtus]
MEPHDGKGDLTLRIDHAQLDKSLDTPVEDGDIEDLYSALNAPVASPTISGPGAAAASKLDSDYLQRLHVKFSYRTEEEERRLQTTREKAMKAARWRAPSVADFTQIVHVNALTRRPEEAQAAFDLIEKSGQKPDLIAYNHLMDAYSRVNNLEEVSKLFKHLETVGLEPDMVTYGIIIHACVRRKDLAAAFRLYEHMSKKGIQPSQPIFTSLIKGCLQANDVARAWKTFDYMRREVVSPDAITYSLMIHACSKTQDAERALSLFEEMNEKGLSPTDVTFTALIQACGSRNDYYNEAFELLGQMAAEGFAPNLQTYNVLMKAAAKQADVVRARLIWNDLMDRAEAETLDPDTSPNRTSLKPNESTFVSLFECYAHTIALSRRRKKQNRPSSAEKSGDGADEQDLLKEGSLNSEPMDGSSEAGPSNKLVEVNKQLGQAPRLTSSSTHPTALVTEASSIWSYLTSGKNTSLAADATVRVPITTKLIDVYLQVLCANPQNTRNITAALKLYKKGYTKNELVPTGNARNNLLATITRNKEIMAKEGLRMWKQLLAWDSKCEQKMAESAAASGDGHLMEVEKESRRKLEGRGRADMFKNFVQMVNGFTRIDDIPRALDTLEASLSFRHHGYLPQIQFTDIWSLVTRSRDLAEDGKLTTAERLIALCPPPSTSSANPRSTSSAVDEVRRKLKMQNVGGGWWGWQALGVEEHAVRKANMHRIKSKKGVTVMKRKLNSDKGPRSASKPS